MFRIAAPILETAGPSELGLIAALQAGDDTALNCIITRWEQPLFAFAWRYLHNRADAQDVVAETFVRLYQKRLGLRANTKLPAWLFTTLSNLCHNQYRWRRRHATLSMDADDEERPALEPGISSEPTAAVRLEQDEALQELLAAVDELPHDLKTVVLLHYFERLSYRDIGAVTGCSERGIETRLYRARQRLRARLQSVPEVSRHIRGAS